MNFVLPFISSALSFALSVLILRRYASRGGMHLLFYGIGMIFYGVGGFCEGYYGAIGWNDAVFRLWYLFGAILVAAWLGQGTVYLLWPRKIIPHVLTGLLVVGSLYGMVKVFGANLDPALMTSSLHTGSELSGHAITSGGVRILTPFFNLYGTLTLVGGGLWSAFRFFRKRVLLHRTLGSLLIAAGAILPAFGGTASRFGIPFALYLGELLGVILIFLGFLRATRPLGGEEE